METPCITLLYKEKCLFFKNSEQEGKTVPVCGSLHQWEGEDIRKGCRRVNMVKILCTHV
jgi:hypothetical protein